MANLFLLVILYQRYQFLATGFEEFEKAASMKCKKMESLGYRTIGSWVNVNPGKSPAVIGGHRKSGTST